MKQQPPLLISSRLIAVSLLLLTGLPCQAEPNEPINAEKPARPDKTLVGSIEDGRYFGRDKSFSFKLPITGSPYELRQAITDTLGRGSHTIVINSKDNLSSHRFDISRVRPGDSKNSNFTAATAKAFDWYRRLIQRAWQAPVTEVLNEEFDWNGRRAAHAIFKQFADATSGPRYHIFYLADFDNYVSFLWTNISLPEENLEEEDKIIAASSGPALKSKQSFFSFRFD